jgi:acetamidase/formamidase
MKTNEKHAIEDLRKFSELLIKTNMLDLRAAMEQPKASMVNILTRNDATLDNLTEEDKALMRSQAIQNSLSSIRNRMEKTVRDVNLYEQVIRICDNLLQEKYSLLRSREEKEIVPETTHDQNT